MAFWCRPSDHIGKNAWTTSLYFLPVYFSSVAWMQGSMLVSGECESPQWMSGWRKHSFSTINAGPGIKGLNPYILLKTGQNCMNSAFISFFSLFFRLDFRLTGWQNCFRRVRQPWHWDTRNKKIISSVFVRWWRLRLLDEQPAFLKAFGFNTCSYNLHHRGQRCCRRFTILCFLFTLTET